MHQKLNCIKYQKVNSGETNQSDNINEINFN